MNAIRLSRILARTSAVALAALTSASARADIFAATCGPGLAANIAIVNATLGTPVALPSSVNTTDAEEHPSITKDGKRLVFRRVHYGTTIPRQLFVVDLESGQTATLFTFDQNPFFGAAIRPEGSFVVTGRSFMGSFATVWISSLSSGFSNITKATFSVLDRDFHATGSVADVAVADPSWIAMHVKASGQDQLMLVQRGIGSAPPLNDPQYEYSQPAMAADNPQIVVFRQRHVYILDGHKAFLPGDLVYRPATLAGFAGTPVPLAFNRDERDESQPALTADGRYIAFVRDGANGTTDRLFVWDTQTQTLLNPTGVALNYTFTADRCGSTSLYTRPVIVSSTISGSFVNATLVQASSIGIFVQRIVGKTEVLGHKEYQLETVGRVPLGSYGVGNVFTNWDFTVGGEPLPPGFYQVTVRAVEGDVVRELGRTQVLWIDVQGRPHMIGQDPT